MKKLLTCTLFLLILISMTGCGKNNTNYLKEITFDELYEKMENKDSFILEIIQDGCKHCSVFSPRFKSVINENKIEAFSLNFSKVTEEELKKFTNDFGSLGTPTVIFIESGNEKTSINRIEGEASKKEITRKLKQNGYIKE